MNKNPVDATRRKASKRGAMKAVVVTMMAMTTGKISCRFIFKILTLYQHRGRPSASAHSYCWPFELYHYVDSQATKIRIATRPLAKVRRDSLGTKSLLFGENHLVLFVDVRFSFQRCDYVGRCVGWIGLGVSQFGTDHFPSKLNWRANTCSRSERKRGYSGDSPLFL